MGPCLYPVPGEGTDVHVEACTDGRVYLTLVDATGRNCQLPMTPDGADALAGHLRARAEQARQFIESG